ncbi:MAG: FMN-binding glutamate synthase family protein [Planctomycetota bacterium]
MHLLRYTTWAGTIVLALASLVLALRFGGAPLWILFAVAAALALLGLRDVLQTRHAIQANYPVIGHMRYIFESVRPEIRQYFIEGELDGRPFNFEQRAMIYQRAKGAPDYDPFGSELDVREVGYEWVEHSIAAKHAPKTAPRVRVGGPKCSKPYDVSLLNVSAMSFGSLGPSAVRALGRGAKLSGFAQSTGEGGVSRYHLETGADLVWQIGTGYFGCRADDGTFDADRFEERARHDAVKMIEVKLSQGAKPGHGGILPGHKVTPEIAEARGVEVGQPCLSPPAHTAFSTPRELVAWVDRLRELSGGKPVGIKLCVGLPHEFMAIVKAMVETGSGPDFVTVDGGEGGTGAAPPEFGDNMGSPLEEGLVFVRNALTGAGLADRVRIAASGKVVNGMDLLRCLALGADFCNAARSFMISIGCIQAQVCHTNHCPAGVATMEPLRNRGLDPTDKGVRAGRFQEETVKALLELSGAAGLDAPNDITPERIRRRIAPDVVRTLAEIHTFEPGPTLLGGNAQQSLQEAYDRANPDSFAPRSPTRATADEVIVPQPAAPR